MNTTETTKTTKAAKASKTTDTLVETAILDEISARERLVDKGQPRDVGYHQGYLAGLRYALYCAGSRRRRRVRSGAPVPHPDGTGPFQ